METMVPICGEYPGLGPTILTPGSCAGDAKTEKGTTPVALAVTAAVAFKKILRSEMHGLSMSTPPAPTICLAVHTLDRFHVPTCPERACRKKDGASDLPHFRGSLYMFDLARVVWDLFSLDR